MHDWGAFCRVLHPGPVPALGLLPFFQRPQASRADMHAAHLAIYHDAFLLHVGAKLTLRLLLRAGNTMSELRAFTADFTGCH